MAWPVRAVTPAWCRWQVWAEGGTAEREAARAHVHTRAVRTRNVSWCCRMGWAAKEQELSHEWGAGITQKCHQGDHWFPACHGTVCGQLGPHGWEGLHVWELSTAPVA